MKFDLTVTFGALINLVTFLLALGISTWRILSRIEKIEWKTEMIWQWYKKEHDINGDGKK